MAIKIESTTAISREITFPILMQNRQHPELIALFTGPNSGVFFDGEHVSMEPRHIIPANDTDEWTPYAGVLRLENN